MKILKRILVVFLTILLLGLASGTAFLRHIARRAIPDYNAEILVDGLHQPVDVYRDAFGVPHVYASNQHDLYMATGYIHAQDRLWQMDLLRRVTRGRLAEIFGPDMIVTDQLFRALQFHEKSARMYQRIPEELKNCLQDYSSGVNVWIEENEGKLPFEFAVLGYRPERWEPLHSMNILGYFTWGLTTPWYVEVELFRIGEQAGAGKMLELLPDPDLEIPVYSHLFDEEILVMDHDLLEGSLQARELGLECFSGSNNWAISGRKSASGFPVIANDMHLQLDMAPGIWYQMHQVVEGELNVTGVIAPGTPVIACGHNDSIAWGFTNVSVDDMDLYLETVNPEDTNQYRFNGGWLDMELVEERIGIRGGEGVVRINRYTHRGPVISGFKGINRHVLSMRWLGREESNEFLAIYLYNRACNWNDLTAAAVHQSTLSQNVVYGDRAGNIGMYTCAGVPMRAAGKGTFVVPGDTSLYDWTGRVPFGELPHVYNPPEGYVISANNRTVPDGYPYHISDWYSRSSRYERIRELITEREVHTLEDMKEIQNDQTSKWAEKLQKVMVPVLETAGLNEAESRALQVFRSWDCHMGADRIAPTIFEICQRHMVVNIFSDEMGEELFKSFSKSGIDLFALEKLASGQDLSWCDDVTTGEQEHFEDMIVKSFRDAVNYLSQQYGTDQSRWQWGRIHRLSFRHPVSRVKVLNRVFGLTRGPYAVGGSHHTVCPFSYSFDRVPDVNHGASQRHIFTAAGWDESLSVLPTGVSGIPASGFFCNQSEMYLKGQYHADPFTRQQVVKHSKYHSVFIPVGK